MPWCPKCRTEYRQGFTTCVDCESELVPKLENIIEDNIYIDDIEAFLITAANNIEAEMLEELLHNQKIPVLKKYRGAGDYLKVYMGGSNFGVDLYVPSKLLDRTKAYIAGMLGDTKDNNIDEVQGVYPDDVEMYTGDDKETYSDNEEHRSMKASQQSFGDRKLTTPLIFIYLLLLCFAGSILYNLYKLIF